MDDDAPGGYSPTETVIYAITERHRQRIHERLLYAFRDNSDLDYRLTTSARSLGIIGPRERIEALADVDLDDGTDDFDFVLADDGSVTFRALDSTTRTDTWFSNREEVASAAAVDSWDPDSDDDGLTDGQEAKWVTGTVGIPVSSTRTAETVVVDEQVSADTAPDDPDTDSDGYWDGWIGVYGVGRSENVVLYMEHLQTGSGIEGDEIVQEQTGVHPVNINASTAAATGARLYATRNQKYHSNLHLGERHWGTDPTAGGRTPDTRLDVEVDYLPGENPFTITRGRGANVTSAIERNMRLYGLEVEFHESDRIPRSRLRTISKNPLGRTPTITPHGFNQWELMLVEDRFHDDESRLHAFWGSRVRDDFPKSAIDTQISYAQQDPGGLALNNGAPGTHRVTTLPLQRDWGIMLASADTDFPRTVGAHQSTTMHELGHALGIGWADDRPIPLPIVANHGKELYSGSTRTGGQFGGRDRTPERIVINGRDRIRWSIMTRGSAEAFRERHQQIAIYQFSIEELSTLSFKHVPSTDKD